MKANLTILAITASAAAIILALDPGRFAFAHVDAGGHSLRMLITGHGGPAVVFEAGGTPSTGGVVEDWERVQPAISRLTTAVSYDRAGCGRSAPGPKPRDARAVARELHAALHHAGVPTPYILVGHSFGGPLNRVFAGMYPGEVCGLVLADPTPEEFIEWNLTRHTNRLDDLPADWPEVKASLDEAHASVLPTGIPVVLITGMGPKTLPGFMSQKDQQEYRTNHQVWLKFHQEWLAKIPGAQHLITEKTGHGLPFLEPELVVSAISNLVVQAKKSTVAPPKSDWDIPLSQ
jgi:pimeloyl-ACP methyl ester carboxylesterase